MPVARTPADIPCLALHTLARGRPQRGFMVSTVAERLGVPFERAEEMADAAAKAGLVLHRVHTVMLTAEGLGRGATLKAPDQPPRTKTQRRG